MRIIEKLIKREYQNDAQLNPIFTECLKIAELEKYLNNLQKIAILYNKSNITLAEQACIDKLRQNQEKLLKVIRYEVMQILGKYKDVVKVKSCAQQINYLIEDNIDDVESKIELEKLYIISKCITDMPNTNPKNSIQL